MVPRLRVLERVALIQYEKISFNGRSLTPTRFIRV